MGNNSLSSIKMIRIVKDLTIEEMAQYFMVSPAYISAIEKNQRKMRMQTLKYGLDNLNISIEDYKMLEDFRIELLSSELQDNDRYKFMLIKTLGIVFSELTVLAEQLLEQFYNKNTKAYNL